MRYALVICSIALALAVTGAQAQAPCSEKTFQNFNGTGSICPCFVPTEEAGAVFTLSANDYPIEILKIGIGWASQFGGTGQSLEQAVKIYAAGLPNPGVPIFTLPGPQLTDGFLNEFNIEFTPGNKIINSGPFTVTLEFLNQNAGDIFAPSVYSDGNGCQPGKNVVKANPGGWADACLLGVTGDWVFYVKYRSLKAVASAAPTLVAFSGVGVGATAYDTVYVSNTGCDTLEVNGINGCTTSPFSLDTTLTNHSIAPGDSTPIVVCLMPTTAAADSCTITVVSNADNGEQKIKVTKDNTATGIASPELAGGFGKVTIVPNPFNPSTQVRFELPEAMPVTADVFDVTGRHVRALARERFMSTGRNELQWDGRDDSGQQVSSGIYLVRVSTRIGVRVSRAVLLK